MVSYRYVHLRIISGHDLPKTDLFSHIDPYVVVTFMGETLGRTITRDNNPNPVWKEDFFFEVEQEEEDGALQGTVSIDLYDEEVTKDEYVGSIRLQLQSLSPDLLCDPLELPITFKSDKRGQKLARSAPRARMALKIVAVGKAFSSYVSDLSGCNDAIVDERSGTVLLPVPDTDDSLWVGLRFTARCRQLLLLSTADPKAAPDPAVWYDLSYSGSTSLRVERLAYRKPVKMYGLRVWSELRATNVPVDAKLNKVRILEREHRLVDNLDPADVLVGHGYMIGMPFLAAVKELSKRPMVHVDVPAQTIWVKMDSNQPQPAQLLQLDYGESQRGEDVVMVAGAAASGASGDGSPGRKSCPRGRKGGESANFPALRVFSTTSELNRGYELAFFGGGGRGSTGPMVTITETFRRPKEVLGGLYEVLHTVELRDAFVGDMLEEVGLGCYELLKANRTWRFGKLFEAAARGTLGLIDEAGTDGGGNSGGGGGKGNTSDVDGGRGSRLSSARLLRSFFSSLPCFAPRRTDTYLEDDRQLSKERKLGPATKHKAVVRRDEDPLQSRGHERTREERGRGPADYRSGSSRARSGGGADSAAVSATSVLPNSPRISSNVSAQFSNTSGGGGGPSRGLHGPGASVESSSDRSASLVTYNSTKNKYSGGAYGGSSGGGGTATGSKLRSVPSNTSLGKPRRTTKEAEDGW